MKIIIVGAGKVGYQLAKNLLSEGNDITVIDKNEQVVNTAGNTLDCIGLTGNGAAYSTLLDAGVANNDLLIATTASDEINIITCLTAKHLGIKNTIARVRNPEYYEKTGFLQNTIGASMLINPEFSTAGEIARILRLPSATKVELFAGGKAELISYKVKPGSPIEGITLSDFNRSTGIKVLICAAECGGNVMIPSGDFIPRADDILYVIGAPQDMVNTLKKINVYSNRAKTVMIAGGGKIAFYLTEMLVKSGVKVKLIEKDRKKAEELAAFLPKAVVLVGDVSDHELLLEEGLEKTDAFIALTGLDEGNILAALYASQHNVRKVIAKVNNDDLVSLMRGTALDSVVSPKHLTVNYISRYVRALAEGENAESVEAVYKLSGGKAEVLEFTAEGENAPYLNTPLMDLRLKKSVLIACIVRKGRAIIPGGQDSILKNDKLLVVTADKQLRSLKDIME